MTVGTDTYPPMNKHVELTFAGNFRVTVLCSSASASFLRLAAENGLPLMSAQDYYEYYGLERGTTP